MSDMSIAANIAQVRSRITEAAQKAGRPIESVRLIAVSKTKPVADILTAYHCGQRHFGENYVKELVEKASVLPSDIHWHFIGSIQRNKIADLCKISNLYAVESVDTFQKAQGFHSRWMPADPTNRLSVFVQVNTSGEDSKSGVHPLECLNLARKIIDELPKVHLVGLMTIGAADRTTQDGQINPDFQCLIDCARQIEQALDLPPLELSMGMSGDYEHAIACGATNVRVGSNIFGSRSYANV